MIYLTVTENWFIYIGIILGSILLIGLILYFTCGFRFKREKKSTIEHVVVDEEFMNDLFATVGLFTNGEYKPEDYAGQLKENGILIDHYKFSNKYRVIHEEEKDGNKSKV